MVVVFPESYEDCIFLIMICMFVLCYRWSCWYGSYRWRCCCWIRSDRCSWDGVREKIKFLLYTFCMSSLFVSHCRWSSRHGSCRRGRFRGRRCHNIRSCGCCWHGIKKEIKRDLSLSWLFASIMLSMWYISCFINTIGKCISGDKIKEREKHCPII